jgi:hypothetical protein
MALVALVTAIIMLVLSILDQRKASSEDRGFAEVDHEVATDDRVALSQRLHRLRDRLRARRPQ